MKFLLKIFFLIFISFFNVANANTLSATEGEKDVYKLITNAGYGYEVPDNSRKHSIKPFRHIQQVYDDDLKQYVFAFYIHALIDDDRGIVNINDRQRVEIKTYNRSKKSMLAKEGETLFVSFKMKLPKDLKITKKFCHFHQLKGIDNKEHTADVKHPLITLTACEKKDGTQKFELRYFDRNQRKMNVIAALNLEDFLGNWVEVNEKIIFGKNKIQNNNGFYNISIIRLKDNHKLMDFKTNSLDLWQTNCLAMRPKWGIYRSLGENRSLEKNLKDEEIRFNDFYVKAISKK